MTSNDSGSGSESGGWASNPWVWVGAGAAVLAVVLIFVFASGGGDEEAAATTTVPETTTTEESTTTTEESTTTTEAPTTTTEATTTTTTAPPVVEVAPTAVTAVLEPYNTGGGELFPPASVEANWYQWDGFYIVLFRGWDATSDQPICTGNSLFVEAGWELVSNSPYNGTMDEVCVGANPAPDDKGVRACDGLLYYLTVIPVEQDGDQLWASLEFNDGVTDWMGQTSQADLDVAGTPEFQPDAPAYVLPPSDFDDLTNVTCGA